MAELDYFLIGVEFSTGQACGKLWEMMFFLQHFVVIFTFFLDIT